MHLSWESVFGNLGRLLTPHCPSAHSDGDIQQGRVRFDWPQLSPGEGGFATPVGSTEGRLRAAVLEKHRPRGYTDLGINPAPSFIGYDLKQGLSFLA